MFVNKNEVTKRAEFSLFKIISNAVVKCIQTKNPTFQESKFC